jgi:hypothetical protein
MDDHSWILGGIELKRIRRPSQTNEEIIAMAKRKVYHSSEVADLAREVEELKRLINLGSQLSVIAGSIAEVNATIKSLTPAPKAPMKADLQAQILRIRNSHLRK